jgi:hypothetical protein
MSELKLRPQKEVQESQRRSAVGAEVRWGAAAGMKAGMERKGGGGHESSTVCHLETLALRSG